MQGKERKALTPHLFSQNALEKMTKDQLIEEIQSLQKQLRQNAAVNEELKAFTYVASHDLKSPLRGLRSLTKWVIEDCEKIIPLESKGHLQRMLDKLDKMEALLDGLLQYSRVGHTQVTLEQVSMKEMISRILSLLPVPPDLTIKVAPTLPILLASPIMVQHVFQSLIDDAIKYRKPNEPALIEITAQDKGKYYEFLIKDNGLGIERAYHDKIFRMFQRLHNYDNIEGAGIGLALVKKILETEKGSIRVVSELGTGSEFIVSWPK